VKVNITPIDKQITGLNLQGKQLLPEGSADLTKTTVKMAVSLYLDTTITEMLKQLTTGINHRKNILNCLPDNIKDAASQIMKQSLSSQEVVSQGLSRLSNASKNAIVGLQKLESAITEAITLKSQTAQNPPHSLLETLDQLLSALSDNDQELVKTLLSNNPKLLVDFQKNSNISDVLLNNSLDRQEVPEKHQQLLNSLRRIISELVPERPLITEQLNTLPELIKLRNALLLTSLNSEKLLKAKELIHELTVTMQKSAALSEEPSIQANAKALSFTLPLYFETNPQPYPAYIHIYHEQKDNPGKDNAIFNETWLRICLDTENIGVVDLTFRLYQESLVNVIVAFASANAANMFEEYIPDIKAEFEESPLTLTDINVK